MKKALLLVVLLTVILSAMAIVTPRSVLAVPCCNNMGDLLCNPRSPEWKYPKWSWWNGERDIIISVYKCHQLSCGGGADFPLPQRNGLKIGDDASGTFLCSNTTIVRNSALKFCQENHSSDYARYQLQGLAGGAYSYYDRGWQTDKSIYCYIKDLYCSELLP